MHHGLHDIIKKGGEVGGHPVLGHRWRAAATGPDIRGHEPKYRHEVGTLSSSPEQGES